MGKFAPSVPTPPPAPDPAELQAAADAEAAKEAEKLRKGRVKTILTSGQGLNEADGANQRKTVLGG